MIFSRILSRRLTAVVAVGATLAVAASASTGTSSAASPPPSPEPGVTADPGQQARVDALLAEVQSAPAAGLPEAFRAAAPRFDVSIALNPARARAMCSGGYAAARSDDAAVARQIMAGRLPLQNHRTVRLPANPTWREDPLRDANWQFQYHALLWVDRLRRVGLRTGDAAMLRRWQYLLRDWVADNKPWQRTSPFAWMDMTVGLRAIIFSCAIAELGSPAWLQGAVVHHGQALSDPRQYAKIGNHAMHQNNGLLALGYLANQAGPAQQRPAGQVGGHPGRHRRGSDRLPGQQLRLVEGGKAAHRHLRAPAVAAVRPGRPDAVPHGPRNRAGRPARADR
jgi:Heparinase II/III N-terminus